MSDESTNIPDINTSLQKTPIAIIGLASIFPKAENLQQYWSNIIAEVDCITDVPPSRWKMDDYYDPDPKAPDKTYCRRGGFMPDIDFNPMEFGLPPNVLEVTDVSQLLSLVVAKQAIKDAGYAESTAQNRERTGVILGVGGGQKLITPLTTRLQYPVWDRILENSGIAKDEREKIIEKMKLAYIPWEENSFPGMLGNVIAGRIANRLDLGGTNCVVDAACAASLAAVKMAVSELLEHRADTMITGGVDTDNSIFMYMSFSKTPAFSRNNDIRPFDVDSDGMMIGEGIGMLVLKRLEDAERDNDRIYAVIRGIGTSSDGKYKSIYAPRASGQSLAVSRAYEDAGFSPASVGLIEAHGTGTAAGDPTEFEGLNEVFSKDNPNKQSIALGSVKSQIGHTKAAAGAASLIKTALALHHKILPPTLNVSRPNPRMNIEASPFYLNTHTRPWIRPHNAVLRRAGVSAFGFGGTNFHFVLEEYNGEHLGPYRLHTTPRAVYLSAETPARLLARCEEQLALLQSEAGEEHYAALLDASQLLIMPVSAARVGFVSESLAETRDLLKTAVKILRGGEQAESWEHPKGIYYRQSGVSPDSKVVALFPGQGSQYLEMGKELALNFPTIRQAYGRIDQLFIADQQAPLSSIIFPTPKFDPDEKTAQSKSLERTEYAQPAIGTLSYGIYKLMQLDGFSPDFVAGHSFGELTALWASGVINDEDYFFLIKARGQAMAPPDHPGFDAGAMLAVKGDVRQLQAELNTLTNVTIANLNSNEQVVLAGPKSAIRQAQQYLEAKDYFVTPLAVSAAFHTPLVGHAQRPFARAIERTTFNSPTIPVYANSTGQPYPVNPRDIQVALEEHILKPVLFQQEIENIYAAGGRIFVEIGPRSVLSNLVKGILGDRPHLTIALNATRRRGSDRQLREAYVQMRVAGLPLRPADPYRRQFEAVEKGKKALMTVQISGNNYVSPKTQAAFEKALQNGRNGKNGNQITAAIPEFAAPAAPNPTSPRELVPATFAIPKEEKRAVAAPPKVEIATVNLPPLPAQASGKPSRPVYATKAKNTDVQPTLLPPQPPINKPAPSTKPVLSLPKASNGPTPLPQTPPPEAPQPETQSRRLESLEKNLALLHRHQDETLRVHEEYLKNQEAYSKSVIQLMQRYYAGETRRQACPAEGAEWGDKPALPKSPNGETRGAESEVSSSRFREPADVGAPETRVSDPLGAGNGASELSQGLDLEALAQAMLEIVSEKTGYPAEMLELEMDMEADLGIDSIKRVEILGAMQDRYPDLPPVNPEELAELRTLGQIVAQMQPQTTADPSTSLRAGHRPPTAAPVEEAPASPTAPIVNQQSEIQNLQGAMLEIVSEKTGYPAEMLELEMDMEADLGIDSIKRVEILGAMQDRYPDLPPVNPEELAELRTLGQIVAQMQPQTTADPSTSLRAGHRPPTADRRPLTTDRRPPTAESAPAVPVEETPAAPPIGNRKSEIQNLQSAMLEIVSEKTGYPAEMLELEMDMEADLGIDSIKRVEILGAMQDRYPDLPPVNPEELAELRTLGQIVAQMQPQTTNGHQPTRHSEGGIVDRLGKSEAASAAPALQIENRKSKIGNRITRNLVRLKTLPPPDFLEFSLADNHICLLTDDGAQTTSTLAQSLLDRGWRVVVLTFPQAIVPIHSAPSAGQAQSPLPDGVSRVTLDNMSEAHLQQQLAAILGNFGPVGAFIHLNPVDKESDAAKAILKHIFLIAKHLKPSLDEAAQQGRACFITAARFDGALGLSGELDFNPIDGGLFGLTKTLNLEWNDVLCRAIDLHPGIAPEHAAQYILAEMHDPNRLLVEVGYGSRGRATLVAEEAASRSQTLFGNEQIPGRSITSSSVFVVSGGAKGITAQCAIELARQHRCKFVLLGRSSIENIDEVGDYSNEAALKRLIMEKLLAKGEKPTPVKIQQVARAISSKREIEATLQAIQQAGGQAEYLSVDVADASALQSHLSAAAHRLGAITGIIHGAGVLSDKLIEKKTEQDFERVYAVKVQGLQALLQAVPPQQLDHLVLFSSAAGFYGNVGQADYALSNEILNKTAHLVKRHHPTCHAVSINWGPWDGGMVTPALKQLFAERHIEVIPLEVGTRMLVDELSQANHDVTQTVVGGPLFFSDDAPDAALRSYRIHRALSLEANPFLYDHIIGEHPVLPTVNAIAWMGNACEQIYPGYKMFSCDNYQVLKGIVFDEEDTSAKFYTLDLEEVNKTDNEVVFKAVIWSSVPDGKTRTERSRSIRYHYRAQVTLMQTLPDAPIYDAFDDTESQPISKVELYQNGTLFHGPSFQGVERVLNISPQKVTMRCVLPEISEAQQGQFPVQSFNSFIADGQFQSLVIWARHFHQAGSLPLLARQGEQYRPIPFGETSFVSMEVRDSADTRLVADIITHDAEGRVYSRVLGAEVTISQKLNHLFRPNKRSVPSL